MLRVKFASLNQSEVIPNRRYNTLQVWFSGNGRENAQIEKWCENDSTKGTLHSMRPRHLSINFCQVKDLGGPQLHSLGRYKMMDYVLEEISICAATGLM